MIQINMEKVVKEYIVSSADWEFTVDEINSRSAAISASLFAFKKYKDKLLMSTVIMVSRKNKRNEPILDRTDFFATHEILKDIGLNSMSTNFLQFTNYLHESKSIK